MFGWSVFDVLHDAYYDGCAYKNHVHDETLHLIIIYTMYFGHIFQPIRPHEA